MLFSCDTYWKIHYIQYTEGGAVSPTGTNATVGVLLPQEAALVICTCIWVLIFGDPVSQSVTINVRKFW